MKKVIYLIAISLLFAGCGSRENVSEAIPSEGDLKQKVDFIQIGAKFLSRGDITKAIASFKEATRLDPKNTKAYFILGQTYMRLKNCENAIENFKTVTELDANNGQAYLLSGGCYDMLGKKDEAIEDIKKSIEIFEKNRDAARFKMALLMLQKITSADTSTQ